MPCIRQAGIKKPAQWRACGVGGDLSQGFFQLLFDGNQLLRQMVLKFFKQLFMQFDFFDPSGFVDADDIVKLGLAEIQT